MNLGLYGSAASVGSLMKMHDVAASNIASSMIPGSKADKFAIQGINKGKLQTNQKNDFSLYLDHVVPQASTKIHMVQGELRQTQKDTDLAISGDGFFSLTTSDGSQILTRNGEFSFNNEGVLVNNLGYVVNSNGGPIEIDPEGGSIIVDQAGEVFQDGDSIGRVTVLNVENLDGLRKVQGGYTIADPNVSVTEEVEFPVVYQGYVESSSISAVNEMISLIQASKLSDMNHKFIQQHDQNSEKLISYLTYSR